LQNDWYRNAAGGPNYDSPAGSTKTNDFWATDANIKNSISSGGECGVGFKMLPTATATAAKPWYSFASGLVTVVVYSTEHNLTIGSEQWLWLQTTLAGISRVKTPFVIATGHRSSYVNSPFASDTTTWAGDGQVMTYLRANVEPLFRYYKVTLHYSGHTHMTSRNCASFAGACAQNATLKSNVWTYTMPGAASSTPWSTVYYQMGAAGANLDAAPPTFAAFTSWQSAASAYMLVTASSSTTLDVSIIDTAGSVLDKSSIVQEAFVAPAGSGVAGAGASVWSLVFALVVALVGSY